MEGQAARLGLHHHLACACMFTQLLLLIKKV